MSAITDFTTTVVTCYYKIPSKHPHAHYAEWIENFMKLGFPCVIYCDEESHAELSAQYPECPSRLYRVLPIDQFETSKLDWSYDSAVDHESTVGHNVHLYKVWNEKVFFVGRTMAENPFHSSFFAWVDIGCFRDASWISQFQGFPDASRFVPEKVTFLQIGPFQETERINVGLIDERFRHVNRIGGTMFAGPAKQLREFAELHWHLLIEAKSNRVFAGKDQSLYAFAVLRHPELFTTVTPVECTYDSWFFFHLHWSPKARILKKTRLSSLSDILRSLRRMPSAVVNRLKSRFRKA